MWWIPWLILLLEMLILWLKLGELVMGYGLLEWGLAACASGWGR